MALQPRQTIIVSDYNDLPPAMRTALSVASTNLPSNFQSSINDAQQNVRDFAERAERAQLRIIGLGVGLGLGIPLLIALVCAILFIRQRRRRQKADRAAQEIRESAKNVNGQDDICGSNRFDASMASYNPHTGQTRTYGNDGGVFNEVDGRGVQEASAMKTVAEVDGTQRVEAPAQRYATWNPYEIDGNKR